jgi:regulator of sigma E protease
MSQLEQIPPANEPAEASNASRLSNIAQVVFGIALVAFLIFKYPDSAKTTAIFLVILGVLVFVHEWGHYQFARWAGMKVNRFALGFPPFIYTVRRNNIDYSIGALPIGGMVDIAGLGSEEEMVNTATGEAAIPQRDLNRPFGERQFQDGGLFWRFMVLFAGPLMNFALAIVVFIGVFSIVGFPLATLKPQISAVTDGGPAAKAGIKSGDSIVAVGGKKTATWGDVSLAIRGGKGQPTAITVLRDGKKIDAKVSPQYQDIEGKGVKVPTVGIAVDQSAVIGYTYLKLTPVEAVKQGFYSSLDISTQILQTIKKALGRNLSSEEVKGIGGPVKIAQAVGKVSQFGPAIALNFAAMLSVNLGLMNLLPLPALDGGRIMFVLYELVARRPFNPRWEGVVHATGMLMLLTFMALITLRDVNAGALLHHFGR